MGKRLFLLLLFSFIGVIIRPKFLTADTIPSVKSPEFNAVQTIIPEKPAKSIENTTPVISKNTTASATKVISAPQTAVPEPSIKNYAVSYYVSSLQEYANTATSLSYSGLYKYSKMIYGHNTANLLGNLSSMQIGEKFTVVENGVIKTYQVASIAMYQKTADGNLENDRTLMKKIATTAMGHDVAMFTCAGTMYGGGDASHRLVVYADAI